MRSLGLELGIYESVKQNADSIYSQVAQKKMPIGKKPWDDEKIETFLNWMIHGFQRGVPTIGRTENKLKRSKAVRVRKDLLQLSEPELEDLIKAFEGIMALDINDPNSYFIQAGYHWYPGPDLLCQHHVNKYNPWHRAYLLGFEDALRSVEGCENVTLPYWDFENLHELPEVFNTEPFNSYVLPEAISNDGQFPKGYKIKRFPEEYILESFQSDVLPDIHYALSQPTWEKFNGFLNGHKGIISAHDSGHVFFGETLSQQEVAAFDPVFWFFHCNWDRLWWKWQREVGADSVENLLTTMSDEQNKKSFTVPVLQKLPPFNVTTVQVVDSLNGLNVDYDPPTQDSSIPKVNVSSGSTLAARSFSFQTEEVSVRVKGINRLKIPGSFIVHLKDGDRTIARKAFFQPVKPEKCENCIENKIVDFDFIMPIKLLSDSILSVEVEPLNKSFAGSKLSQKLIGSPTINARLLITD